MSSGIKTALLVGLLGAVVFAATFISQLSPKLDSKNDSFQQQAVQVAALDMRFQDVAYDPRADDVNYHYRWFPGFFEVGSGGAETSRNWVGFAMRNLRPTPAVLSALPPSCNKCTNARAMAVPPDAMNDYFRYAAAGNLFPSPFAVNPLIPAAWARMLSGQEWLYFDFADPRKTLTIPPGGPAKQSWILLELDFKIYSEGPPNLVKAYFDLFDTKSERLIPAPYEFRVTYASREAFEVWPRELKIGELPEGIEPRTFEIHAFSMTRDDIPAPTSVVNGPGPGIAMGTPVKLDAAGCAALAAKLSIELKAPVRVRSAWRIPVVVTRDVPGTVPETGDFERIIELASDISTSSPKLAVKGQITGAVRIDGGSKIELGAYDSRHAVCKDVSFVSERTSLELELVTDRCEPAFLQLKLGEPIVSFGRKTWPLSITIAEQQGRRPPWIGTIVLREKGANAVIHRFPITGHGR